MRQILCLVIIIYLGNGQHAPRLCTPEGKCGQCITNSDCLGVTPYCDTKSLTCHECTTDAHCRSDSDCNRSCVNRQCAPIGTYTLVTCDTAGEVCYPRLGLCLTKCTSDFFCSTLQIALHYPNTGVCQKTNGRCFDCLVTSDCKPFRNLTCGAQCIYNSDDQEYLCPNGNVCSSTTSCTLSSESSNYSCYKNNASYMSYSVLSLLFLLVLLY